MPWTNVLFFSTSSASQNYLLTSLLISRCGSLGRSAIFKYFESVLCHLDAFLGE